MIIQSIRRADDVLSLFSRARPEWTASEIASALGLTTSTAFNIACTLKQLGFVEQAPDTKRYRLGPRLIELAVNLAITMEINQAAAGTLYRLAKETGLTARVICWDQDAVLVTMEAVPNTLGIELSPQIGPRGAAYCTAPGRTILAFMDAKELKAYLETTDLVPLTPRTIYEPKALFRELENIRKRGYAVTRGEVSPNLAGLAAPIYNRRGEVNSAVSLGGEVRDLFGRRKNDILRQLLEASREISAMIGYLPDTTAI